MGGKCGNRDHDEHAGADDDEDVGKGAKQTLLLAHRGGVEVRIALATPPHTESRDFAHVMHPAQLRSVVGVVVVFARYVLLVF